MTPEGKEALLASIKHWEENLAAWVHLAKIRGNSCPLSNMTETSPECGVDCYKCPIPQETGRLACQGTPWKEVETAIRTNDETFFVIAAQREIAFLRSLLPREASEASDAH